MNIAILGFGKQGRSAYEYWRKNNHITICDGDENLQIPEDASGQLGSGHLQNLDKFDLIIRSPIVHPKHIIEANTPNIVTKITSNTNEFLRVCPTKNVIGVTGTKGKGTTSTLITKILEANRLKVHLGGNIGIPPLDLLENNIKATDWVVLELANFQLIDLKYSPPYTVCLMVIPEHLDWQTDLDEYIMTKQQLFRWQKPSDYAVYYADNDLSKKVVSISQAQKIPYYQKPGAYIKDDHIVIDDKTICHINDIKLLGRHNLQNVCAAITATWQITQNINAIVTVLKNFTGLPYRIEFRREVNGISFFNDSFASAPSATIAAIESIKQPKVVIIGGFDRNLDLDELVVGLKNNENSIRHIILIGQSAQRVSQHLKTGNFSNYTLSKATTMTQIVEEAKTFAHNGDAIILSPGFASFGMFKNFEDRGQQFNDVVAQL